ncbi:MAG: GtrA family protein [Pseudomonadota bacterium]
MNEPKSGAKTLFGKLVSFAFAGGTGMVVDLGVLRLLIELGATPFLARIPAIALAMATTWLINRNFTFGASGRSVRSEGSRYATVAIIGAFLNYAIYSVILIVTPDGFLPELATIIAVGIVTIFSYLGYSRFVFGDNGKK